LAIASPWIRADMVEANEFPELSNRYQVYGVPRTIINDVIHIEGAQPESSVIEDLMTVLDESEMKKLGDHWDSFQS
jgi:predicted DsbA family dithiol-disulfide isomerase